MNIKSKLIRLYESILASELYISIAYRINSFGYRLRVMTPQKTIAHIAHSHCSIARYGDGEFELILQKDRDLGFQIRSEALSVRLTEILASKDPKLLICIPSALNSVKGRTFHSKKFWYVWGKRNDQHHRIVEQIRSMGNGDYVFGDSQITRQYIAFLNVKKAAAIFQQMRKLWDDRDLLIVEGQQTRLGIGNDLFDNANSIKRILCPATNAFERIDDIVDAVKQAWQGELILLALGPTATVLAAELSCLGMQALDIGHVDIEYEWFLRGAKDHDQIPGKFTNEAAGGSIVAECDDAEYQKQIICEVS